MYAIRSYYEESFAVHRDADRGAEEDRHDVDDLVLGGLRQPLGDAALAQEVAQHQHADQGGRRRHQQDDHDRDHGGEDQLFKPRDLPQRLHPRITSYNVCYTKLLRARPGRSRPGRGALTSGVLAGYPVTGVKVELLDGSYHDVDSSEMAFKIAGSMTFKESYNFV